MTAPWLRPFAELVETVRAELVQLRAAAVPGPAGPKGDTGDQGTPGTIGPVGPPGIGEKGGRGDSGERGEKGDPAPPARDGRDGKDGKDGIASLDELRAEVARAVDARVEAEVQKRVAEAVAALPTLQYQGVYQEGREYRPGHCATWAGSLWHADALTGDKPGEGKTAWTLMVKKGRDAR